MFGESLFYFTTTKLITVKNKRVGFLNHCIQGLILSYILWDLIYHELYKKVEIPSGYTTFWTENGKLSEIQENTNFSSTVFCGNTSYNYAYDTDEWVYSNFSCVNLPYAEMYEKGENEFFFLTHFTEYNMTLKNCPNSTVKCSEKTNQDFFTVGSEGMLLAFDHFYTTTFDRGSNVGNTGLKLIDTYIKDSQGNIVRHFGRGDTIKLYVQEWLDYAHVNLDDYNEGTPVSMPHPWVPNPSLPFNRMSGVEIIIEVDYHNIEYFSGYDSPTCEIKIQPNSGWASKGSQIHYLNYPHVADVDNTYTYVDRYRYGIKFKFIVSGLMGEFNMNSLITHLVSGIVLVNMSTLIVSCIIMYFTGDYGKYFSKLRYTKTSINVPCFKKCSGKGKIKENEEGNNTDNQEQQDPNTELGFSEVRKRRTVRKIKGKDNKILDDRIHQDIYLDSESSYNYSSLDEDAKNMLDGDCVSDINSNSNVRVERTTSGKEIKIVTI